MKKFRISPKRTNRKSRIRSKSKKQPSSFPSSPHKNDESSFLQTQQNYHSPPRRSLLDLGENIFRSYRKHSIHCLKIKRRPIYRRRNTTILRNPNNYPQQNGKNTQKRKNGSFLPIDTNTNLCIFTSPTLTI